MATDTIKFKRGVKSKLNNLSYGEPAFISDENELYIGTESGIEKLTSNKEVKELSSQLTQNENVLSTVNNALKNISYDVTMLGVKGDGTDETEIIQNIIDSMPEGCTLLFPANYTFRFSSINITKCININATGSTLIHTVSTDNFIKVNADNVSIVGGKYLLNNIDGIIINNDNVIRSDHTCLSSQPRKESAVLQVLSDLSNCRKTPFPCFFRTQMSIPMHSSEKIRKMVNRIDSL